MHLKKPETLMIPLLLLTLLLQGCQCAGQEENPARPTPLQEQAEDRIQAQRDFLEKERASIESYIEDRKLEVKRSGTGLFYKVSRDSSAELQVESGDDVVFDYSIYLLNGNLLYTSEPGKPRSLKIDREDAEIGLHESLKLLGLGDEGLFILPSHLAFGVAGDQSKVPPKTALVYELKVLKITKSKS